MGIELKSKIRIVTVVLLSMVAGCAANGPRYSYSVVADNKQADLYVFRPYSFLSGGLSSGVYIDNEKVGVLKNGGYLSFDVSEGVHQVRVGKSYATIGVKRISENYLRYRYGWALFHMVPIVPEVLTEIGKEQALIEINDTKLSR